MQTSLKGRLCLGEFRFIYRNKAKINRVEVYLKDILRYRFKKFEDLEFWDVDKAWSVVVRVDVKFPINAHGDMQRFILVDIIVSPTYFTKRITIMFGQNSSQPNIGCY